MIPETYGYAFTSRPRVSELSGSDPEAQRRQMLVVGVALSRICGPHPAPPFTVGKKHQLVLIMTSRKSPPRLRSYRNGHKQPTPEEAEEVTG